MARERSDQVAAERQEVAPALRAPFPWFGGKSRVAPIVWQRFGDVRNYVEPFAGSLAVLLARPGDPGIETVNDADCYLSNFWRAVAADPDQVGRFADWPVNEADLHARHRWLVETARERIERLKADPDYFDAKVAGWWVWGQCLWIGSGWCASPEWTGRVNAGRAARGINTKLPAIAGRDGGRGAYAKSRARDPKWEQRPHLGSDGEGQGIIRKRPALTGNGGGCGVHKPSLGAGAWQKRPVLQQGAGGRGVHRLAHQIPDLAGDSGAAGRGVHAGRFLSHAGGLLTYMRALSERLRRVRVCCGDFERTLGPAVTTCIGLTGVFLDPPYDTDDRAICYTHDGEEPGTGKSVWWRAYQWAIDHGEDRDLRIALCGYEHPEAVFPPGWECIAWKASGGYGRRRGKENAHRERIWFSPHCLSAQQLSIFSGRSDGPRQHPGGQ